jgi:hypothetical protein
MNGRRLLLLVIGISSVPLTGAELRVGRAAVAITPPVGAPMGSSYGLAPAAGIRDDLFAKAIVLELGAPGRPWSPAT